MIFKRKSGILLHPTSLPGAGGIGTIGRAAYNFVDWLVSAEQSLWQVLPLGPTGYGDSPYASFSTFAGNPLLIDLDMLVERGWAEKKSVRPPEYIRKLGPVDFGVVTWWKNPVLKDAAAYFLKNAQTEDFLLYKRFCKDKALWLDKYAIFMSIKSEFDARAAQEKPESSIWFMYWPKELARCEDDAVLHWKKEHSDDVELYKVIQFFFDVQWTALKKYANDNGIELIGDIPIFVASDSADVWANQDVFQLDENGRPLCVAGVPPDYFSADGQLWGNPLYDWEKMKLDSYAWWIKRIKRVFELTDVLRVDHFRGFEAYWSIQFGEKTAVNGKWIKGPGLDLFKVIRRKLGDIPVIAEDLGVITDEVRKIRDDCGFPGMKVLQFAFSTEEIKENGFSNTFMPHMFDSNNCVVYTGTHDNDTMQGWLESISDDLLLLICAYIFGKRIGIEKARALVKSGTIRKEMIKLVLSSTAAYAIIPMQDIIGAGNEARMNMPSTTGSNWTWRMKTSDLSEKASEELGYISNLYGRNID